MPRILKQQIKSRFIYKAKQVIFIVKKGTTINNNINNVITDVLKQLKARANCTSYGEHQAFVSVEGNRDIEIIAETYGLEEKDYFYSIRLNCNEEEYEAFHGTYGVIECYNTADLGEDNLRKGVEHLIEISHGLIKTA